jgi:IstB-like ATP binding protein
LVLDELGYLPFAQFDGELVFHLTGRGHERASIIVITNQTFASFSGFATYAYGTVVIFIVPRRLPSLSHEIEACRQSGDERRASPAATVRVRWAKRADEVRVPPQKTNTWARPPPLRWRDYMDSVVAWTVLNKAA